MGSRLKRKRKRVKRACLHGAVSARKIFRRISWLIPSLTAEMVRYVEIDYIFKHPFEAVSRAYFQKVSFLM